MVLPQPGWRVKTQPCPFYQKKRCLFNDACNFIHDVSVPSTLGVIPDHTTESRTPPNPPKLVVQSPSSLRSPHRSPRTTNLLLALKDVIGDVDEPSSSSWSEGLPTLVDENGFPPPDAVDGADEDTDDLGTFEGNWTAVSDYSDEGSLSMSSPPPPQDAVTDLNASAGPDDISQPEGVVAASDNRSSVLTERTSGLLSPIELSSLNLGPFRWSLAGSLATDTNAPDTRHWKPPTPLQPSPPRSPSIASTFGLLSSPFGSRTTRILSPRLSVFMPGSPRSPLSPCRTATAPTPREEIQPLDLGLDSPPPPQDSTELLPSTSLRDIAESWNNRDPDAEIPGDADSVFGTEDDFVLQESEPRWDVEGGETAVYTGFDPNSIREQVCDAIKRSSRTPMHFLSGGIEPTDISPDLDDEHMHKSLAEDACMSLPRLLDHARDTPSDRGEVSAVGTPPSRMVQDNSFNSFYDIYSGIATPKDILADSIRNARLSPLQPEVSNVSTPASSSRERVFTPPPLRISSGPVGNGSHDSAPASPLTSFDPTSSRTSPALPKGDKPSLASSLQDGNINMPVESRRVSLAFRSSSAARRAAACSISRVENSIPPLSPLEPDPAALISPTRSITSVTSSLDSAKPRRLKTLHLSSALNSDRLSRSLLESPFANSFRHSRNRITSASVSSSTHSMSNNRLLFASRPSSILVRNRSYSAMHLENNSDPLNEPLSAPLPSCHNVRSQPPPPSGLPDSPCEIEPNSMDSVQHDETIRQPSPATPHTAPVFRGLSPPRVVETPRPTLMFAIASDNAKQVRQVLDSGECNPNEAVGPQSALGFTLTNDKLTNKLEIVKVLLAYGADPESAKQTGMSGPESVDLKSEEKQQASGADQPTSELDHATRYYLNRANAIHAKRSSALIQRSFFRPLTRVRYELIGQDRALEQLFRVLSMRSRELTVAPIVVLLCGPSGHGKSLLARKFGTLLDVPTHTVNMTTLSSSQELWQSYSMSPYEEPSSCTLAEFLVNNEGRRCVVVLDEVEKTANEKILWSLYMPWELGRYALESNGRHVDVRNVIWLGTSNIGHDLIFDHQEKCKNSDEMMSREEYLEVMALLRSKVSEQLGASVLSRVTTVLPFVPFTLDEKRAICAEALSHMAGDAYGQLEPASVDSLINCAIAGYYQVEGVRSLHRSISNQLLDIL